MIANWRAYLAMALALTICVLAFLVNRYHDNAMQYKAEREQARNEARLANATINTMQQQQVKAAEIDAKYTKELRDAKETVNKLRADVANGTKRLSIRTATCVSKAATAGSMGNAGTAELSGDARQDYYRLREELATSDKQIRYLQDYIRSVVNGEETKADSQAASAAVRR